MARASNSSSTTTTTTADTIAAATQDSAHAIEHAASKTASVTTEVAHEAAAKLQRVLHWDDILPWQQVHGDPLIKRGYRRQLDSFKSCFHSLFYPHNELINTWSHLLPAMGYMLLLLGVDYEALHRNGGVEISTKDSAVMQLYVAGTAGCLLLSAFFHCINAHSEDIARRYLKLDYLGITLSISVTNISSTYFGLHDDLKLQTIYMSISIVLATIVLKTMLAPNVDGPKAGLFRVIMFAALIGSGFFPITHRLITEGPDGLKMWPMAHIGVMTACYFSGAVVYVTHLPESRWPETFDIFGASHQIFHTLIAIGQFIFMLGIRNSMLEHYPVAQAGKVAA